MIDFDFSAIKYRRPYETVGARVIHELIGFDSEAYADGSPFMFCFSDGRVCRPEDLPRVFFRRAYINKHFMVWNLRYESGAILRPLPKHKLRELARQQKTTHRGFTYTYYPHKFLKISHKKNAVSIWDGAGFYQMSLDRAASKYLGKRKLDMNVKGMTRAFVRKNWAKLVRYCTQDATLTRDLGHYMLRYLGEFGIEPSALYSQASVSFLYFKKEAGVVDVWRFWRERRRLLYFACQAYAGGKFEMTRRGRFEGEIWDITSAYPHEIAQLPDLEDCQVVHSTRYQPDAHFAFLHADVEIAKAMAHPLPLKFAGVNTYPVGVFSTYMTKPELDYLLARRIPVKVNEAYWIKCRSKRQPYDEVVRKLYAMKELAGEDDIMKYDLSKKLNNGFYGKMVQLTALPSGQLRAGPGWNPIYGAHVTAKVRVRMAEAQELLGRSCFAVHTDSVLTSKPLPRSWRSEGLGGWKMKKSGEGVVVACGVYEIAGKSANRGYDMKPGFSWVRELRKAGNRLVIPLTEHRPLSWVGSVQTGHVDRINEFMDFPKELNLNSDVKRFWPGPVTARALLRGVQDSIPRMVFTPEESGSGSDL